MIPQEDRLAQGLIKVREERPVVHTITNWITANEVAGALHAIGARPIMAIAREEVEEITSKARALVLNIGTPSPARIEAILLASLRANKEGIPVLLDPVGVGASEFRTSACERILSTRTMAVIRGNTAEIGSLAGQKSHLAGIDSVTGPHDLLRAAQRLSGQTGAVVAASGPRDLIVSGNKQAIVENGHPMMGQVTGMGCMLTAVIGAFHAVESDPMVATVSALAFFGVAGEQAAMSARGPGTFKIAFFDALFSLTPDHLEKGMKITF